jgi:N-acetylglucosaminyldiphosphoundecaprenol N-acetyl-beta-D-mannosaminyltransferase
MLNDQVVTMEKKTVNAETISNLRSTDILGVRIHQVTMNETLRFLEAMAKDGKSHHVVTVNPEFIMTAQQDRSFRDVLNSASIALPDGIGVVLASRWLGQPITERIPGVDVVEQFASVAQRHQLRLFLLGAAQGVAEIAARRLQEKYPGLCIAGTYAGSPHPDEEDEICQRIAEASPQILFVAYGAPQQDLWIARNLPRLKVPIAMGVGGSFDFIAGITIRAPRWIQEIGLEWLHRLIREPYRWRRMLALPQFVVAVIQSSKRLSA